MSNFAQVAAFVVIGGVAGASGWAFLGAGPQVAEAAPAAGAVEYAALQAPVPAEAPQTRPDVLSVRYATTGAAESGESDTAFAVFVVEADEDVADVDLFVDAGASATLREAVGYDVKRAGSQIRVPLGEMSGGEERKVVVAFELDGESAEFSTHSSYRDLHDNMRRQTLSTNGHSITRGLKNGSTYETVRKAYSKQAIDQATALSQDGQHADALEWVKLAYATNVEVGLAMRLTGELKPSQNKLSRLQDELEEAMRPKKRIRRAKVVKPQVEVMRGDDPNRRDLNPIYNQ